MPADFKFPEMPDITMTIKGIAKLLLYLNLWKVVGPVELKPRLIKEFTNEIEPILTFNISKITKHWSYSNDWKTAHFVPVYKIGPKYNSENYRPISLIS